MKSKLIMCVAVISVFLLVNVASATAIKPNISNTPAQSVTCDITSNLGLANEYVRAVAGPILTKDNDFIEVIKVRNRDGSGNWTGTFSDYTVMATIGCTPIKEYEIGSSDVVLFDDSAGQLTPYYSGSDTYGTFGVNVRNNGTGAYTTKIITVKFN